MYTEADWRMHDANPISAFTKLPPEQFAEDDRNQVCGPALLRAREASRCDARYHHAFWFFSMASHALQLHSGQPVRVTDTAIGLDSATAGCEARP